MLDAGFTSLAAQGGGNNRFVGSIRAPYHLKQVVPSQDAPGVGKRV